MRKETSELTVIIDRFEGDERVFAVIELPDLDHFIIPVEYLPPGVSEGEALLMRFTKDPEATSKAAREVKRLQAELLKR